MHTMLKGTGRVLCFGHHPPAGHAGPAEFMAVGDRALSTSHAKRATCHSVQAHDSLRLKCLACKTCIVISGGLLFAGIAWYRQAVCSTGAHHATN